MDYILEIRKDGVAIRAISVSKPTLLFGRAADADVTLEGSNIAAHQIRLEKKNGELLIFNLDTRSQILVNGQKVQSTLLRLDDVIEIGGTVTD